VRDRAIRHHERMLIVSGAAIVWTGTTEHRDADVRCEGASVLAVEPTGTTAARRGSKLDAAGCVVIPGLVNAHHHLLQSAFRTAPDTRHRPMRDWLAAMRAHYARVGVDDELAAAAARVGLAESLLCGVTTVADHHLTWPADLGGRAAIAGATAAAARELGARLVFVHGSAGDDAATAVRSVERVLRELGRGDDRVVLAVGPSGVHADGEETFRALGELAATYDLLRRTQANEQIDVEIAQERHGCRPLDLLDDWGWLAPDVTLAHCCDVTDDEIARLAAAGVSVTHAPGCDLPQGWGVAPVGRMLDAGIAVGLGTSGGGSNDAGHLLADARLAMQVAPLAGRALDAREVLTMATRGGAAGLARPDLGLLDPGAGADLCVYEVDGVADAGVADPVAGLVWAAPGRRPRHVVVGGEVVVRDYALVRGDERRLAERLRTLLAARGVASP
jgi:8-oxoguanine deaminase